MGVFDRILAALAGEGQKPERIMIDATQLKAHRTATSLLKKGLFAVELIEQHERPLDDGGQRGPEDRGMVITTMRVRRCRAGRVKA